MRTEDGGTTWNKIGFENSNRRRISNLVFTDSGFGLAVGELGTLYALENDRISWQKVVPPTRFLMLDAAFAGEMKGAIVGGGGMIMFTEDAGVTWSPATFSRRPDSMFKSVYFTDSGHGWAVGANGSIYQTINGGRYWRRQYNRSRADLNGVYFVDDSNGWAIGDRGTVLRTSTGGNVWSRNEIAIPKQPRGYPVLWRHRLDRGLWRDAFKIRERRKRQEKAETESPLRGEYTMNNRLARLFRFPLKSSASQPLKQARNPKPETLNCNQAPALGCLTPTPKFSSITVR